MNQTVAQYLVKQLTNWGVSRIYGVAGSEIIPILDAIAQQDSLSFIAVRHESAAGFMAATEAKLTGKLAVCLATSGPGLTNLMNGIADAAFDHVPVLAISGQIPTKHIGTHYKQYLNQQKLVAPIVTVSEMITHPEGASSLLLQAMQHAILQHAVSHISIPVDIQAMACTKQPTPFPSFFKAMEWEIEEDQVDRAIEEISQSERPIILIGGGVRSAAHYIPHLAEQLGAGIIASLGAKALVPGDHAYHIGGIGDGGSEESIQLLQEADLLLMIGCTWYPTQYIPEHLKVVQIDVNPDNIGLDKELICSIIGKAENILPEILYKITNTPNEGWVSRMKEAHQQFMQRLENETALGFSKTTPIHPAHLIKGIEENIPENCIVVVDTGEHTIWFNRYFKGKRQRVLFSGKWRSMGYALPAANAAKMIYPKRQVIAIIGDGSLLMNAGELSTTIRYNLPVKIIVFNNQSLILEERKSLQQGYQPNGTSLTNPDFAALAKAFGWEGLPLNEEPKIGEAIKQALSLDRPVLIDAHISHDMPKNIQP